jgi:hypothetical protein
MVQAHTAGFPSRVIHDFIQMIEGYEGIMGHGMTPVLHKRSIGPVTKEVFCANYVFS